MNSVIEILKAVKESGRYELLQIIFPKINGIIGHLKFDDLPSDEVFRKIIDLLSDLDLEELLDVCAESIFGNIIWLNMLCEKENIITNSNIHTVLKVLNLKKIDDVCFFQPNFGKKIFLRISEGINLPRNELKKVIDSLLILFRLDLLEKDKELVDSFRTLYLETDLPDSRKILREIEIILESDESTLISEYNSIFGEHVQSIEEVNWKQFFDYLVEINCPVFFELSKVKVEGDKFYNGNFFVLVYKDLSGNLKLLKPFSRIKVDKVQKILDISRSIWATPPVRPGKILLEDIYSFRNIRLISRENASKFISRVIDLSEDEIEEKLRKIVGDIGSTPHTSTEVVDYYTYNLRISSEEDLREAGVIIKGKSFGKQITLKNVANQIIKAVTNDRFDLIILIHIPQLADDVRIHFERLCLQFNKMYAIIGPEDLTRLFLAYNVI